MRHWYAGLSLRTKITCITVLTTILSLTAVATLGIFQIGREIASEQHRTADSVALGVARASELAMTVRDGKELTRLANNFLRDENVLFVAIYEPDATKPLAMAVRDGTSWEQFCSGMVDQHLGVVGAHSIDSYADTNEFSGDADADEAAPSSSSPKPTPTAKVIGKVVVCLSTIPTINAEQQIRLTVAATAIAAIAGAGVLFLVLGSSMRRLHRLAVASQSISRGDFSVSVNDPHDDEIGRLGQSFDGMRLAVGDRDRQLREFADTLQEQVHQRTADLEKALAAAEEASRAKSLFLANMSHELRTPLNGVIGMVDLLLAAQPNPQQKRYCEVAKASARALLELINDILDFSKIEAGKLELDFTDFNLHEVIESVTQVLGDAAEKKRIELICSVGESVPRAVRGDSTRLRQVVLNLATNAVKFTDQGEVVINACTIEETETHATVKISVRDSGIGIPRERQQRLFKSFSQVDSSTTRKFGGTGLGLAISHRIVDMMGGKIGVDSEEGRGSTFWIEIRFEKRPSAAATPREIGVDPRGLRALVVDDNSTNREILAAQLGSWHLQADIAGGAREALEMLDAAVASGKPYRFAILDMRMPKTDGLELAGEIKANPKTQDVILISLSSIGDPMSSEQMGLRGFSACLTKPALPSQLYDAIVDSLSAQEQKAAPANSASPGPTLADVGNMRLDGVRVLLAEDNAVNRFVASELLSNAGCVCNVAVNGREAMEMALREEQDVILMDCQMPEMDGFEAARAIRQAEAETGGGRHRAIIALTANAIKGDRELCLAAGMDDYVTKPISPPELIAAIRRQLPAERRAALDTLHQQATPPARAAESGNHSVDPATLPIDINALQQRCMGNTRLASKALKIFETSLAKDVENLLDGLARGDAKTVGAAAHKIKGAAANVSAEQVRTVAGELEKLAKADALAQTTQAMDALDREIKRFEEYLATALADLVPPQQQAQASGTELKGTT
jgi:signal transduction histidine kinase/CheY-like chemotaxis protein/HPt (histidine-containing phosphotransfer) domain-containing protein